MKNNAVHIALTDALYAEDKAAKPTGWDRRHNAEVKDTYRGIRSIDAPSSIIRMLDALAVYADEHARRYDSPIGQDGVLGDAWCKALGGVRAMLNGETGNLDCGTVDGAILAMVRAAGFEENDRDVLRAGLE